ncbi:glutathione S-transferase family protein [Achromobacter aloeverae]|uniref:Glutathione S-transferase n=1 Tax=Achromobacter aloeverae TaxID=1750518 RepID=A0A4V1MRQ1_9BURK|nr:glutathione S-transferase family protein [Achromobacter aloeverae]RXN85421.1 glutathione S-transferase [Achromobacter aloeverae]
MALILYDLAADDTAVRFSPHCWKTRMALAHKGLQADYRPWRFTEKAAIAFSGQEKVPVLVDGDETIHDSWRIARHLDSRYPDRPALFTEQPPMPLAEFVNAWADKTLVPAIARIILLDIHACLHPTDQDYFRASREKAYGQALESVVADRAAHLRALGRALSPLRHILQSRDYIDGTAPAYADYCVFGMFMWARCVSAIPLLQPDDPVHAWRERLLDAHGGMARSAPVAAA